MNMNKKIKCLCILLLSFLLFQSQVFAACHEANFSSACAKKTEGAYKCKWESEGGAAGGNCVIDKDNCASGYYKNTNGECSNGSNVNTNGNNNKNNNTNGNNTNEKTWTCENRDSGSCNSSYGCNWNNNTGKCENANVLDNPCSQDNILHVLNFLGYILWILVLLVPLLIVGFGTYDIFKAVIDKDEKSLAKQLRILGIRIVIGLIIFFLPKIVNSILDLTIANDNSQYQTCIDCVLSPTNGNCKYNSCVGDDCYNNSNNNNNNNNNPSICPEGEIYSNSDFKCHKFGECEYYISPGFCPSDSCEWNVIRGCVSKTDNNNSETKENSCDSYLLESTCTINNCKWENFKCTDK